jgi:hypothetical protein
VTAERKAESLRQRANPITTPSPLPLWPWGLVGLITVPLAVGGLLTLARVSPFIPFGDADWYATAVPAMFSDQPLYDPSKLGIHVAARPPFWNQPPSTALFALLIALPGGRGLWGFTMIAFVLLGLVVLWPQVGLGGTMLLLPVLIVWLPVPDAIAWANVNAMVFGLLALAWRFPRVAGWAIGIAAAAKLVPLLAVAWLVGKRDWRNALLAVGIFVVATLIVVIWKGPETIVDFVVVQLNERSGPALLPRWGPVQLLQLPDWVAYASAAAVTLLAIRYASLSLAIVAMLLSVPALHLHYLTWLLIPILGIWLPRLLGWISEDGARGPGTVHARWPPWIRV